MSDQRRFDWLHGVLATLVILLAVALALILPTAWRGAPLLERQKRLQVLRNAPQKPERTPKAQTLTELGITPEMLQKTFHDAYFSKLILRTEREKQRVYVDERRWPLITGEEKQLLIDSISFAFKNAGGPTRFTTTGNLTHKQFEIVEPPL